MEPISEKGILMQPKLSNLFLNSNKINSEVKRKDKIY